MSSHSLVTLPFSMNRSITIPLSHALHIPHPHSMCLSDNSYSISQILPNFHSLVEVVMAKFLQNRLFLRSHLVEKLGSRPREYSKDTRRNRRKMRNWVGDPTLRGYSKGYSKELTMKQIYRGNR
jgi:hypothetical protein